MASASTFGTSFEEPLIEQLNEEDIKRAWVLVDMGSGGELRDVARAIMEAVNTNYVKIGDEEFWHYGDKVKSFVVRADVVTWEQGTTGGGATPQHIMVAVSAVSKEQVREIAGVIDETVNGSVVQIAMVDSHFPVNPIRAAGYIASQEANHDPGPKEGYNHWG